MLGDCGKPDSVWNQGVVRHEGSYARVGDIWRPIMNHLPLSAGVTSLSVYSNHDVVVKVPVTEVERIVRVRPWATYRGIRFILSRVYGTDGNLVWRDVPIGEPEYTVALILEMGDPSAKRVSSWKAFKAHHDLWAVRGKVLLSEIEDYTEQITEFEMPPIRNGVTL